jgi:hypothetical protein
MITNAQCKQLAPRVESAVKELFETARKNQTHPGDIILFCENGHYDDKVPPGCLPYLIGPGLEGVVESDRLDFFKSYLTLRLEDAFNKETSPERKLELRKLSIHLELMIYAHFWESSYNLRALKQLANLVDSRDYDWNIKIPETGKYDFIKKEIRGVFEKHGLNIAEVIAESYLSQIRNAFAHCQYFFGGKTIIFVNYDPIEPWSREKISFDDWEKRFSLSALLDEHILGEKSNLEAQFAQGSSEVRVRIPKLEGGSSERSLVWHVPSGSFVWKRPKS